MEDRYKSCAIAIVITLLLLLAILVLPMLVSCRSHKVAAKQVASSQHVYTMADSASETATRTHWLRNLALDMDSFEMIILPLPDTPAAVDSCTLSDLPSGRPRRQAAVVLRGRHASIGKTDYVESDLSARSQQRAASSDSSSLDLQQYKDIDTTGIAKPPNTSMVMVVAIIVAAAVILILGYLKYRKVR